MIEDQIASPEIVAPRVETRRSRRGLQAAVLTLTLVASSVLGGAKNQEDSYSAFWNSMPRQTTDGFLGITAKDPVNIFIEGSKAQVLEDFNKIGWMKADSYLPHLKKAIISACDGEVYKAEPVSPQRAFGKSQDFSVVKASNKAEVRDHGRAFDSGLKDPKTGLEVWAVPVSRDLSFQVPSWAKALVDHYCTGNINYDRRWTDIFSVDHQIDPLPDKERDKVVKALQAAGFVDHVAKLIGWDTAHTSTGSDPYFTDGQPRVVFLKQPKP